MSMTMHNRVLMLLETCPFPQDSRVRQEAHALVGAGYQVTVIAPMDEGESWHETVGGVRVYRFPVLPPVSGLVGYLFEYGWAMGAIFILSVLVFSRRGFDVIHAHNPPDTLFFIAAFYKLFGKRFVFDQHDLSPELYGARFPGRDNRLIYTLLLWSERLSYWLADQALTANGSYKALSIARHKISADRVTVVRNGPALDRLRPVE